MNSGMRQVKKPRDFEKFYYRYVASGEGCGCAERIIDVHEMDRLSNLRDKATKSPTSRFFRAVKRLFTR